MTEETKMWDSSTCWEEVGGRSINGIQQKPMWIKNSVNKMSVLLNPSCCLLKQKCTQRTVSNSWNGKLQTTKPWVWGSKGNNLCVLPLSQICTPPYCLIYWYLLPSAETRPGLYQELTEQFKYGMCNVQTTSLNRRWNNVPSSFRVVRIWCWWCSVNII